MSNETLECAERFLERVSDGYRVTGLFLFVLTNFVLIGSLGWWWLNRENARLAVRPVASTIFMALYVFCGTFLNPLNWYSLDEEGGANSCPYKSTFVSLKVHAFFVGIGMRIFAYRFRYILYQSVSNVYKTEAIAGKPKDSPLDQQSLTSSQGRLNRIYFLSSNRFLTLCTSGIFVVFLPVYLVLMLPSCPEFNNNAECLDSIFVVVGSIVTGGLLIILFYTLYETWYFDDVFGISREGLVNVGNEVFGTILLFVCYEVQPMKDYFDSNENLIITPEFFFWMSSFANLLYSFPYQVYLSRKRFSQPVMMSLSQVLKNPGAKRLFEQHLRQEGSLDNLIFYVQATEWERQYDANPGDVTNKMADNIYARWLKPDARFEVNVSNKERAKIEELMETTVNYPRTLFDDIAIEIFSLIENDSFMRFRNGPLFRIFVGLSVSEDALPVRDSSFIFL